MKDKIECHSCGKTVLSYNAWQDAQKPHDFYCKSCVDTMHADRNHQNNIVTADDYEAQELNTLSHGGW